MATITLSSKQIFFLDMYAFSTVLHVSLLFLIRWLHNLNYIEHWLNWFIIAQLQFKRTKQEAEEDNI